MELILQLQRLMKECEAAIERIGESPYLEGVWQGYNHALTLAQLQFSDGDKRTITKSHGN